ncbi:hypothetical protein DFP72DRAFT_864451 [Ephemerocybe angulata]|uniref:Uncharacterized protein n=1 Tax=Ephemerocybe angulata TaxID=980116 RepID=A0A8H6H7D2_9AGAR|nr:hypothetical protein DFP72DRAFT_864451 [Tulosesus angulatus]
MDPHPPPPPTRVMVTRATLARVLSDLNMDVSGWVPTLDIPLLLSRFGVEVVQSSTVPGSGVGIPSSPPLAYTLTGTTPHGAPHHSGGGGGGSLPAPLPVSPLSLPLHGAVSGGRWGVVGVLVNGFPNNSQHHCNSRQAAFHDFEDAWMAGRVVTGSGRPLQVREKEKARDANSESRSRTWSIVHTEYQLNGSVFDSQGERETQHDEDIVYFMQKGGISHGLEVNIILTLLRSLWFLGLILWKNARGLESPLANFYAALSPTPRENYLHHQRDAPVQMACAMVALALCGEWGHNGRQRQEPSLIVIRAGVWGHPGVWTQRTLAPEAITV